MTVTVENTGKSEISRSLCPISMQRSLGDEGWVWVWWRLCTLVGSDQNIKPAGYATSWGAWLARREPCTALV